MEIQEYVPYLSVDHGPRAVAFYSQVFDTKPWVLLNMPDGRVMHCEFRIGNTRLFLSDELLDHGGTPSPETVGGTTVAVHIYVTDCDKLTEDMARNGAKILMQPTDMFWGVRFSRVRDPFGHEWGIATQLSEMSPEEIKSVVSKMFENELPKR